MAKKSPVNKAPCVVLEYGFVFLSKPEKKLLDISVIKKVLQDRGIKLRIVWGSMKYDKLLQFCKKCLNEGNEKMIITVVAKGGDIGSVSYQCLFECGGSQETFVLNASFFEDFGSSNKNGETRKNAPEYTPGYAW